MKNISYENCIQKLSASQLKQISETHGILLIPFSSQASKEALLSKINQPDFVDQSVNLLDEKQKKTLIIINFFCEYLTYDQISSVIKQSFEDDTDFDSFIQSILKTGLVFHIENKIDKKTYFLIPQDIKKTLDKFCKQEIQLHFQPYEDQIDLIHKSDLSIHLPVFSILIASINHELKFNNDLSLNQRSINKIKNYIGVESGILNPDSLSLYLNDLTSYLRYLNIIEVTPTEPVNNIPCFDEWIDLSIEDKLESFYNFLIFQGVNNNILEQFARFISILPKNTFFDISSLEYVYGIFFNKSIKKSSDLSHKPFHYYPIFILFQLGIIEFASKDIHKFCGWKITENGHNLLNNKPLDNIPTEPDNKIIIQPNFEMIISRKADHNILWKLYRIADLTQCELLLRFHLSHDSIYRGLSNGVDAKDILNLIESNVKNSVAQNVIYSIKEWCEEYGAVYFVDVCLLRCKNKNIAEQIKHNPKVKDFVKGNFSDTDLICDRNNFEQMISLLTELGFMPIKNIVSLEDKPSSGTTGLKPFKKKIRQHKKSSLTFENVRFIFD